MSGRAKGKVAVVTGGASGIGAATAKLFVDEGGSVIIADLQEDLGKQVAESLGQARFVRADVTREADVAAAVDLAVQTFGGLDCMVNNAGMVGSVGSIMETTLDAWNRTISVLLTGTFLGIKHASRVMVPKRAGCIISLASTAGVMGGLGPHAYTAAKHGVIGLTKSAASELVQHGVRVNAVAPGGTHTPLLASAGLGNPQDVLNMLKATSPNGEATMPEDIAEGILFLASDGARQITGHTLVIDVGSTTTGGRANPFHSAPATVLGEQR